MTIWLIWLQYDSNDSYDYNMTYDLPEVLVDFMTIHIVYDTYDYKMTYD